jgi:hypothetical protein
VKVPERTAARKAQQTMEIQAVTRRGGRLAAGRSPEADLKPIALVPKHTGTRRPADGPNV